VSTPRAILDLAPFSSSSPARRAVTELRDHLHAPLGAAYIVEPERRGGGVSRTFVAEERDLGSSRGGNR